MIRSATCPCVLLGLLLLVGGCTQGSNDDDGGSQEPTSAGDEQPVDGPDTTPDTTPDTGEFSLEAAAGAIELTEGDAQGMAVEISLVRDSGFDGEVALGVETADAALAEALSASFSPATLSGSRNASELILTLEIGTLPRQAEEVEIVVTATSGSAAASTILTLDITPVDAPDVYLLIGQSNMVGFSGDNTRLAGSGQPDAPNPRIRQLHVSPNDSEEVFTDADDYTSVAANIEQPPLIDALDPLHDPLADDGAGKDDAYIGPGLSFAKAALPDTDAAIVLVPAAWSGSAFCRDEDAMPLGGWNPEEPDNPNLGNTLMFDRAVLRVNEALDISGGILRGILWHQGENDANEGCASLYRDNLTALVSELRQQIDVDAAGAGFRGAAAPIPFIIGTMSRGADERGDLSVFGPEKQLVDDTHRELAETLPFAGLANLDDLTPDNGYPCGNTTCIHFGPEAQRIAGARYYEALQRAIP